MTTNAEIPENSYPLDWPTGWPRTQPQNREQSRFKVSRARAIEHLFNELNRLGASNPKISSNIETYEQSGKQIPYANQSVDDPGIAVYFEYNGKTHSMACDKWQTPKSNIRAIGKTIEALRGIERWGSGEMMEAAFEGYERLPSETTADNPYYDYTIKELKQKLKETHPDHGGNAEEFQLVKQALDHKRESTTMTSGAEGDE